MYTGTSELRELLGELPKIESFDAEPVPLPSLELLQFSYEIGGQDLEALLPPALHPTIPMVVQWQIFSVADSPWGAFNMCAQRLTCRSGARPRTMLVSAVVNQDAAATALAAGWGYKTRVGEVIFDRTYDKTRVSVIEGDAPTFVATAADPDPLTPSDLQFFATMHGAETPSGPRLVQVDSAIEVVRAERYTPVLEVFDPESWGDARIVPAYPVTAFGASADVTLPVLRFVCRPDVMAFEGTERVA